MTREEEDLIKEAYKLGFDRATVIKPAHLVFHNNCPEAKVPATAKIVASQGNLMYEMAKGDNNLEYGIGQTCMGIIYQKSSKTWATIIENNSVSNKNLPPQRLREFPDRGMCWKPTEELLAFLKKRYNTSVGHSISMKALERKGLVWNTQNMWMVLGSSGYPEYKIEQLLPFLPKPQEVLMRPLTPEECFPPNKWYIDVTADNQHYVQDFLKWKRNEYKNYRESWNPNLGCRFYYPQCDDNAFGTIGSGIPHKGYTRITTEQLVSIMLGTKVSDIPEKWCIENKEDNFEMINVFMHKNKKAWSQYRDTWQVDASHSYFHYPPVNQVMHSDHKPNEGYKLITTQQFITHVLTHTDKQTITNPLKSNENGKQEGGNSIKVQRSNLSIRDTDPIRAVGIRCSKIKIKVGSGHLPN